MQFNRLRRREFITLLGGGAAAAWPLAARAQQGVRLIGILMNLAADDPEGQARVAAFLQGLQEAGWVVGRNARECPLDRLDGRHRLGAMSPHDLRDRFGQVRLPAGRRCARSGRRAPCCKPANGLL